MTDEFTPYIEFHEGDPITAEDLNRIQTMIKEDIANQVGDVKQGLVDADILKGGR